MGFGFISRIQKWYPLDLSFKVLEDVLVDPDILQLDLWDQPQM